MKSKFITAKEIAPIVEHAPRHVRRESFQKKYGLVEFRDRCEKPIRWLRRPALDRLRACGVPVPDDDYDDD